MNHDKVKPFDLDYAIAHPEEVCDRNGNLLNYVAIFISPKSGPNDYVVCCRSNGTPHSYTKDGRCYEVGSSYLHLLNKDPIAFGRNPQNVTVSQLGEGYRLATAEDVNDPRIEIWIPFNHKWSSRRSDCINAPFCVNDTYRVPITPYALQPCGPEDFPPGTAIRMKLWPKGSYRIIVAVSQTEVTLSDDSMMRAFNDNSFMQNYERLLPGTTAWLPCHK